MKTPLAKQLKKCLSDLYGVTFQFTPSHGALMNIHGRLNTLMKDVKKLEMEAQERKERA